MRNNTLQRFNALAASKSDEGGPRSNGCQAQSSLVRPDKAKKTIFMDLTGIFSRYARATATRLWRVFSVAFHRTTSFQSKPDICLFIRCSELATFQRSLRNLSLYNGGS
jgi:hypothetical protein